MATINAALAALERYGGFPQSRSRGIARRLQEAGQYLQVGKSGTAPGLNREGFLALFLALASDAGLRTASDAVTELLRTTPGGVSLEGAPMSVGTARSALLALMEDTAPPTSASRISKWLGIGQKSPSIGQTESNATRRSAVYRTIGRPEATVEPPW